MRKRLLPLALIAALTLTAACEEYPFGIGDPANDWVGLTLVPDEATVKVGERTSFQARVTQRDGGSLADIDAAATWTSSDPAVATVDVHGGVLGVAPGEVTVTAFHAATGTIVPADLTATARLRVTP
jgi:uncharacterized protein YjdB